MRSKNTHLLIVLFLIFPVLNAQSLTKNVLFIGNSYIYTNDLPAQLSNVAASMGDVVISESSTPGGYTLKQHSTNATTLSKIGAGTWDFVVLQEQSQIPSFPIDQVMTDCFPYATLLDDLIHVENICSETVFFMTWGRKEGDAGNCPTWPPICTYNGMDSLLNLRYSMMAEDNDALLAPVGQVWHYIRDNYPEIELYNPDLSHPSINGTYAAAITFYTILFQKDPQLIPYNGAVSAEYALSIRNAVKTVVFDSLDVWHVNEYVPQAQFDFTIETPFTVNFNNLSVYTDNYLWDFGDGNTSTEFSPSHNYIDNNNYSVQLIASKCENSDTVSQIVEILPLPINNYSPLELLIFPNPVSENVLSYTLKIESQIRFEIFSSEGKLCKKGKLNIEKGDINISDLTTGLYMFKVYDELGYSETKSFTVVR